MATVSPKTFFISYGLAEGPWHGRALCEALMKNGFRKVSVPRDADIIVTHSRGSFLIPRDARPTLAVIIATPFAPKNRLLLTLLKKIWSDLRTHRKQGLFRFWLAKTAYNTFYLFRYFPNIVKMAVQAKSNAYVPHLPGKVVMVRNSDDPFCAPEVSNHKSFASHTHTELPGGHDDCWSNPAPYIALIKKYYEQ